MNKMHDTPPEVSSIFVPERHLWTPEAAERFLDDDGNIRRSSDGSVDFEPIPKPLISEDYPLVDVEAYARAIKGLFIPDAKFPRTYRKDISAKLAQSGLDASDNFVDLIVKDNREHVQQQKLYKESGRIINMRAFRFCDLAERSFKLQWLVHNAATHVFGDAVVPEEEVYEEHIRGEESKVALLDQAIITNRRGRPFSLRLDDIRSGRVLPKSLENLEEEDETWDIATISPEQIFARDKRAMEHFKHHSTKAKDTWKSAVDTFSKEMPNNSYYAPLREQLINARPKAVIAILGTVATRDPWHFSPFFSGRMTIEEAKRAQRNRYIERVAEASRFAA